MQVLEKLNEKQRDAVLTSGHTVVTACPGSGKTRVLTRKVAYELANTEGGKRFVVALTYTRRAAEEIKHRLDRLNVSQERMWAGTIHSFCLDWILRPYAGYCERTRDGFSVADEHTSRGMLNQLREEFSIGRFTQISTKRDRAGHILDSEDVPREALDAYDERLRESSLIDFDLVIHLSYRLLRDTPRIATTLSHLIHTVCVDEYQDTQELQYSILGQIVRNGEMATSVFMVGDPDQAIYWNLGGVAKTPHEISTELGGVHVHSLEIDGCYRTCQRLIDFYRYFQVGSVDVTAVGDNADEVGTITFDHHVTKDGLYEEIARLISMSLALGIPQTEICVVAPQWEMIIPCARHLRQLLPDVGFEAPGISPFRRCRENLWYEVARLLLVEPSPTMYATRMRWANRLVRDIVDTSGILLPEGVNTGRRLLRFLNTIESGVDEWLPYLKSSFSRVRDHLLPDIDDQNPVIEQLSLFMESAIDATSNPDVPADLADLKALFRERRGVVVNSCHGLKGEEFETVIAYGLLKGKVPNWNDIMRNEIDDNLAANRLLYVVCSRARSRLHLIAEQGRATNRGNPYAPTEQLAAVSYSYDNE